MILRTKDMTLFSIRNSQATWIFGFTHQYCIRFIKDLFLFLVDNMF